jgi:peptidoglycan/LPS O-acetylase OafA/YrhL
MAVCLAHLVGSRNGPIGVTDGVRTAADWGFHGVTAFFVISGFVLPLALTKAGYHASDFGRFFLRRAVRLEPPYLAAVALAIATGLLASATPGYSGPPFHVDWLGTILHVGYLVPLFDKPWIVGVFWTLLVEMQFYILIGLTFGWFKEHPTAWVVMLALPAPAFPNLHWLGFHLPMFLLGSVTFAYREKLMSSGRALTLASALSLYLAWYKGVDFSIATVGAALYILIASPKSKVLLFLGSVSYSLYLIHLIVGPRATNLALRIVNEPLVGASVGVMTSIAFAWLLWRCIEVPALNWASRIGYGTSGQKGQPPTPGAMDRKVAS